MRHYRIDWDKITENFEQEEAESGLWTICDALQKIEKVYAIDNELKGLNLPLYLFVSDAYGLDTEKGAVRIRCGFKPTTLPLKKIGTLQHVIPCHRAHAVTEAVLDGVNTALERSDADSTAKYNFVLKHISISMEYGLGNYDVITTRASYQELEAAWLRSIR